MRSRGAHLRRVTAGRRAVGDGPRVRENPPSRKERSRKLVNVNMFSAGRIWLGCGQSAAFDDVAREGKSSREENAHC